MVQLQTFTTSDYLLIFYNNKLQNRKKSWKKLFNSFKISKNVILKF